MCLANNHVLDYGVRGLRDTLNVLRRRNIAAVGAGLTEDEAYAPLTITRQGVKIHIVNISEGEDLTAAHGGPGVFGWDIPRAISIIRRLKRSGGVVIVIAHCGLEYIPYPPPYVVTAFRAMAAAGADAVVGHHPHVPQGIEWRNGVPIVYSLGNFLFYQHTNLLHRKVGFCVTLELKRGRVAGLGIHPYRITDHGLRCLTAPEEKAFHTTLRKLSQPFATPSGPDRAWQSYLAYYGPQGFQSEVSGILDRMKTEPHKAAAMFRNRLVTMQHIELWRDWLTRAIEDGRARHAPAALACVVDYFTRTIDAAD